MRTCTEHAACYTVQCNAMLKISAISSRCSTFAKSSLCVDDRLRPCAKYVVDAKVGKQQKRTEVSNEFGEDKT